MATTGDLDKRQWCVETRRVLGTRPTGGTTPPPPTPNPKLALINRRMDDLRTKIGDFPPDKAEPLNLKVQLLARSIAAGNLDTVEGPLGQLEMVVNTLWARLPPKPSSSPPPRRPPPPVPTRTAPPTPVPTDIPPPPPEDEVPPPPPEDEPPPPPPEDEPPPPPRVVSATLLKSRLKETGEKLNPLVADGGPPAAELKREFDDIVRLSTDKANHPTCIGRLDVLAPKVDRLIPTVEAARLAAAKAKVHTLSAVPRDDTRKLEIQRQVTAETATKTTELKGLVTAAMENQDEQIHRDVFLGIKSTDKSYTDNVTKPCDDALQAVAAALEGRASVTPMLTKQLELLLIQLDEQRAHYDNKKGITDPKMLAQRTAKVAAIDKRKESFKTVIAKVDEIAKLKQDKELAARGARRSELEADGTMKAVTGLVTNLKGMLANDPAGARTSLTELKTFLSNSDSVTRQAIFSQIKDAAGLAEVFRALSSGDQDVFVADAVSGCTDDTLLGLSNELIRGEVRAVANSEDGRASALRANTLATKLSGQFNKKSSKNFIDKAANPALRAIMKTDQDLELDPTKMTGITDPKKREAAIAKRAPALKKLAQDAVTNITSTTVPPDVSEICATIFEEAMAKFDGDEEHALSLVGGHVMLRLINPAIATAQGDPSATAQQKRILTIQSKLLQNISNGIAPGDAKEAYLKPLDDLFVDPRTKGPSAEVAKMQAFFKQTVKEGKRSRVKFNQVLGNDAARAIFKQFTATEFSQENVDFWELAKNGVPADPQAAYNTYVAGRDPVINIGGPTKSAFDEVNELVKTEPAPDGKLARWKDAPWGDAVREMVKNMQRDTFPRFQKSRFWDETCALFGC